MFALETCAKTIVYQQNKELAQAVFEKDGGTVKGHITGGTGCKVRLVNCILTDADGAAWEICGEDTVLTLDKEDVHFWGNREEYDGKKNKR